MNIYEAIKEMEKGKKVRRHCWKDNSYWKIGEDESICWSDGNFAQVHLNQIRAKDFEVFELPYLQCGYEDECSHGDCVNCGKKNTYCFDLTQAEECAIEDFAICDLNELIKSDTFRLELMQKVMKKLMKKIFKMNDKKDSNVGEMKIKFNTKKPKKDIWRYYLGLD